jgi:mRNA deadenylase 3'-5' endonuclease subunit Ccr4
LFFFFFVNATASELRSKMARNTCILHANSNLPNMNSSSFIRLTDLNACNFCVARSMAKNRTTLSLQNNPTGRKFYVMQTRRPVQEDTQSLNQLLMDPALYS